MRYVFLPPYSPDFNPIELAFSAIKACIRCWGSYVRDQMTTAMKSPDHAWEVQSILHKAVFEVTPAQAAAWFHHCRYFWWPNYIMVEVLVNISVKLACIMVGPVAWPWLIHFIAEHRSWVLLHTSPINYQILQGQGIHSIKTNLGNRTLGLCFVPPLVLPCILDHGSSSSRWQWAHITSECLQR